MDNLIYVTADGKFSDIDIYACSIAYAELLRLKGLNAVAVVSTKFTDSITPELKKLKTEFLDWEQANWDNPSEIVIVDRSDLSLDTDLPAGKVMELYDHHFGHEEYWKKRLGEKSHIEKVGSCATLIWEEAVKSGLADKLSSESATLLYAAVISNTLNLNAGVTTDRDIKAAGETRQAADLPPDFTEKYFEDVSTLVSTDPFGAMLKDVKVFDLESEKIAVGQLELWSPGDAGRIINQNVKGFLPGYEDIPWFITIASISDGTTTLIAQENDVKQMLELALNIKWYDGNVIRIDKLLLRKEIVKNIINLSVSPTAG